MGIPHYFIIPFKTSLPFSYLPPFPHALFTFLNRHSQKRTADLRASNKEGWVDTSEGGAIPEDSFPLPPLVWLSPCFLTRKMSVVSPPPLHGGESPLSRWTLFLLTSFSSFLLPIPSMKPLFFPGSVPPFPRQDQDLVLEIPNPSTLMAAGISPNLTIFFFPSKEF